MEKNRKKKTGAVKFILKKKKETEKREIYQVSNKKQINYIYTCISYVMYNTFVEYQHMKNSTYINESADEIKMSKS